MLYERRRDYRFAITLKGAFCTRYIPILVENVAYRGVLLVVSATSSPITIGQLGQFGIVVPDEGKLSLHGVPVRLGPPALGGGRLLGVRLIGIEPRWERFVRSLHATRGACSRWRRRWQ